MRMEVQFTCGCSKLFSAPIPKVGDWLLCDTHGPTQRATTNWCFACTQCKYNRRTLGEAPVTAETKAVAHSLKFGHKVRVWKQIGELQLHEYFVPKNAKQQLVLIGDDPPF